MLLDVSLRVFLEMIDIQQKIELEGQKKIESEQACLVDWEHENKGRAHPFISEALSEVAMILFFPVAGTADPRFFSLSIHIQQLLAVSINLCPQTLAVLFICLILRPPASLSMQLPPLTESEYDTSPFLNYVIYIIIYSLLYTYTFS